MAEQVEYRITGSVEPGTESGEKRFYLPGVAVEWDCTGCGKAAVTRLGDHYLSYPVFNEPFPYVGYCNGCEQEVTGMLCLTVKLEVASNG